MICPYWKSFPVEFFKGWRRMDVEEETKFGMICGRDSQKGTAVQSLRELLVVGHALALIPGYSNESGISSVP